MASRLATVGGALVMLTLLGTLVPAQEPRATLLGVISDPSGAVVAGAKVTAINAETAVRCSTESNQNGNYVIPYLAPGTYRLRVECAGFKPFEQGPIELRISDRLRIDVMLRVGDVETAVVVAIETPLLETATASAGTVVDARRMAELPVAHGNPYQLMQLGAGVIFVGDPTLDRPFEPTHIVNYSIDGAPGLRNDITLDGVPNSSMTGARGQTAAAYVPPADIVGEMKITSAPFDASVGHTEGGVVSISLKSGTNQFHGTGYLNKQTPELFANSWFANRNGQQRPDFTYNRWGLSAQGPVRIPGLYDGRNRTFFMWGYEGIHERRPRNNFGDITVPTAAQRQGDLSSLLAVGPNYQIYDPATRSANPSGAGLISEPFAGNIIPKARISPIATNILKYFALPNTGGAVDGRSNLSLPNLPEALGYYNHTWRVDHDLGERHRIFARASVYKRLSDYFNFFDNLSTGEWFRFLSRGGAIDDVYTITPSVVLNLRYGYNRFVRWADLNPASYGFDLTSLAPGNPAWDAWNRLIDAPSRRFPLIDIAGYFNLVGTSTTGVLLRPTDTHSFVAALDKTQGRHALKFGGEYRVYRKNERNPYAGSWPGAAGGSATGWLQFGNDWTKGPTDTSPAPPIGAGLASFLLGLPTGGGIDRRASYAEQSTALALYLQDDWNAGPRLAISVGVRYELEGPLTERYNRSVRGFDPTALLPIGDRVVARYAAIAAQVPERPWQQFLVRGGVNFAGVGGLPRGMYARDANNFMPRVGVAYSLTGATVLRAGYGIYFGPMGIRRGDVYQTGFGLTTPLVASLDNGLSFAATLDNPFPNGVVQPPGASLAAMANVGDKISFFNTGYVASYMQRWQFSVQRLLPGRVLADISYVGNRGTKLETTRNLDGVPDQYLSTAPDRDQARIDYLTRADLENPFYGVLLATTPRGSSMMTSRAALLAPYPQFTGMETTTNQGYSWYHSLQLRVDKRFSGGYTFGGTYSWSKLMEAVNYLNPMDPMPYETISATDVPHRLSMSGIYELPFGRGRKFLSGPPRLASAVLSGWQLSVIYLLQSGQPLNFGNIVFQGDIHNIPLPAGQRSVDRWFNTEAGFLRDSSRALDMNVRTFPLRFSGIRGPGADNWDVSLLKNSKIGEKVTFQLRGEFLNAMNRPWFQSPNTDPYNAGNFGRITGERGYPRRIQLGVKLIY